MKTRFALLGEVPPQLQEYVEYTYFNNNYGIVTVVQFTEENAARRADAALADNVYVWTCPQTGKEFYVVGTAFNFHFIKEKRNRDEE